MWQIIGWIVSSVLGAAIWTLVIRQSPIIITNLITAKIKHNYDEQIAQLKGEMARESTAMQSTIGLLSASQSELRSKVFQSVEALWMVFEKQRDVYRNAFLLLNVCSPNQLDYAFQHNSTAKVRDLLRDYSDFESLSKIVSSTDDHLRRSEIIYVSARLWLIYMTIYRTQNRIAGLMHNCLKDGKYIDWRIDDMAIKETRALFSEDEFKNLTRSIDPDPLINSLKAQFIEEARKLIRGETEWESVDDIYRRLMSLQQTGKASDLGIEANE